MKKAMRRSLVFVLSGLVLLTMAQEVGSVRARSQEPPTIQIEDQGVTSSIGTTTVSALCPQNYHAQSGQVKIEAVPNEQGQAPMYNIPFNGPSAQRIAWTTTVANKNAANLRIIVTATCVAA